MVPFCCFFFFFCLSGTYNIFKCDHIGGEDQAIQYEKTKLHSTGKHGFPCCQEVCCCNCPGVLFSPRGYNVMVSPAISYERLPAAVRSWWGETRPLQAFCTKPKLTCVFSPFSQQDASSKCDHSDAFFFNGFILLTVALQWTLYRHYWQETKLHSTLAENQNWPALP